MARMTLTMTDELYRKVRAELPGLNVSGALQELLRAKLRCEHSELECRVCRKRVWSADLERSRLAWFYGDCIEALEELVVRGGTAEGAARVLKTVAERYGVQARRPLPRPTRAERQAVRDQAFTAAARQAPQH